MGTGALSLSTLRLTQANERARQRQTKAKRRMRYLFLPTPAVGAGAAAFSSLVLGVPVVATGAVSGAFSGALLTASDRNIRSPMPANAWPNVPSSPPAAVESPRQAIGVDSSWALSSETEESSSFFLCSRSAAPPTLAASFSAGILRSRSSTLVASSRTRVSMVEPRRQMSSGTGTEGSFASTFSSVPFLSLVCSSPPSRREMSAIDASAMEARKERPGDSLPLSASDSSPPSGTMIVPPTRLSSASTSSFSKMDRLVSCHFSSSSLVLRRASARLASDLLTMDWDCSMRSFLFFWLWLGSLASASASVLVSRSAFSFSLSCSSCWFLPPPA
mmetsp:Transcript_34750/g.102132  ORF Transcript_34750/g.102132 Transcript_34750/m.102132 type:complete len:332 (+) Transcript_34750:823-1818(+)